MAEVAAWWVPLAALWLVLAGTVDPLELAVSEATTAGPVHTSVHWTPL
ncbi:hypothetical protein [Streptomyces coelicoflavus]|uniref:Uncharacterized protein n=1 Tax=Streptomyces coelicoflavus TaxID=285562 RepID=A0A6N9UT17_9ACTN|nr:hypothetical protein [Streptomyces coelicoflavus]NEB20857.1 hypothetical protein [Streptomyces coelicoflavus]